MSASRPSIDPGEVLRSRYEIDSLLRHGVEKDVYRAHDRTLDCFVALDVFSNNAILPNGMTLSAWETRVLGRLGDHPNIAEVVRNLVEV